MLIATIVTATTTHMLHTRTQYQILRCILYIADLFILVEWKTSPSFTIRKFLEPIDLVEQVGVQD